MNFNEHSNLIGKHAFLSPSQPYWLNYDDEKLRNYYKNQFAVQRGIELHDFACRCIQLDQKLQRSKRTLNSYVNDAIGFRMTPEQVLYYSDNCFGTADAIFFDNGVLRVHDLKTGVTKPHMDQLLIYAALFCLEYGINPRDIETTLRIYQNDDIAEVNPTSDDILKTMDKIVDSDSIVEKVKDELK